ncbi:hypothetical protein [Kaarinaea lacus]
MATNTMQRQDRKLKLIWNVDRFRCQFADIEIAVASAQFPPFSANAVVEEQDTSLVLGESNEITDPGNKPVWYFANKLQSLAALTPGEIIVRKSRPVRIQAIVHDLDQEPTCQEVWVEQAIEKIISVTNTHTIYSLQMPVLGTRYGDLETTQVILFVLKTLTLQRPTALRKLWLVTTEQECESVFQLLNSLLPN